MPRLYTAQITTRDSCRVLEDPIPLPHRVRNANLVSLELQMPHRDYTRETFRMTHRIDTYQLQVTFGPTSTPSQIARNFHHRVEIAEEMGYLRHQEAVWELQRFNAFIAQYCDPAISRRAKQRLRKVPPVAPDGPWHWGPVSSPVDWYFSATRDIPKVFPESQLPEFLAALPAYDLCSGRPSQMRIWYEPRA